MVLQYASKKLQDTKEVVMAAVNNFGGALAFSSAQMKNDKEVVLAAVLQCGRALEFAAAEMQDNEEVAKTACRQWGEAIQFASKRLRGKKELVIIAMENDEYNRALKFASDALKKDHDLLLRLLPDVSDVDHCFFQNALEDRVFVLKVLQNLDPHDGASICAVAMIPSELYEYDREVMSLIVTFIGTELEYASEELHNDRDIVLNAVRNDGKAIQYASPRFLEDKDIALAAVSSMDFLDDNAHTLSKFPKFRNDRDVVLAAVKKYGNALQFASLELRYDREIVKVAVLQDGGWPLNFTSNELRGDPVIVSLAIQAGKGSDQIMSMLAEELYSNRQVMMLAVHCNGLALSRASVALQDDTELVMAAVSSTGCLSDYDDNLQYAHQLCVLRFASHRLQRDETIVMAAILNFPHNILHVDNELKMKIPFMAKFFAAISTDEDFFDQYYGLDGICDRGLSRRISNWLDSFDDPLTDWLQAVDQHDCGVLDFGTDYMSKAYEKRWLLGQYFCQGRVSLPFDVQNHIFSFTDVPADVKAGQETINLAPILNELFKPTLSDALELFRDFDEDGLA